MGVWSWLVDEPKHNVEEESRSVGAGLGLFSLGCDNEYFTEKQVLTIPSAKASRDKICGSIAALPINLYRTNEDGSIEQVTDDYRLKILNKQPNLTHTGYDFKERLISDLLFHGSSYTVIEKEGNKITELWPLNPHEVAIEKYVKNGYRIDNVKFKVLNGDNQSKKENKFDLEDILVAVRNSEDGLKGVGVLEQGYHIFKLAMAENELSNNIFENGVSPSGILKVPQRLSDQAMQRLRSSWDSMFAGSKKAGKTIVLEGDTSYEKLSFSPSELGLNTSRSETNDAIAKLMGVPQSLLDSKANSYGSVEQMNIIFLQYCIEQYLTIIEESFNRSLLLESEKDAGYFFEFDVKYFNRATESETINAVDKALKGGIISLNEARERLNLSKIERDAFKMNLGDVFMYTDDGSVFIPNMNVNTGESGDDNGSDTESI